MLNTRSWMLKSGNVKNPRVVSINALWGRNSGPYKFIEADVVVQARSLERAHFFISKLVRKVF